MLTYPLKDAKNALAEVEQSSTDTASWTQSRQCHGDSLESMLSTQHQNQNLNNFILIWHDSTFPAQQPVNKCFKGHMRASLTSLATFPSLNKCRNYRRKANPPKRWQKATWNDQEDYFEVENTALIRSQ